MINRKFVLMAQSAALAIAISATSSASAQEAVTSVAVTTEANDIEQSPRLEEIVVTAQKRAESLQEVPIAVTAVSSDVLRTRQVTDIASLTQIVPNAGFSSNNGELRLSIRGITFDNLLGTGAEARSAFHVDGTYISRSGNIPGTFFDIDRVEVLRGPQGTLFGRNAIAGAVNVITKNPTDIFEGYLQGTAGNYSTAIVEGGIGGPIVEGVSARIAFQTADHDGYGRNLTNRNGIDDQHQRAIRGKIQFEPSSVVTVVLAADYSKSDDNSSQFFGGNLFDTPAPGGGLTIDGDNVRRSFSNTLPMAFREYYGFSLTGTWEISDGLELVSLSGYRKGKEYFQSDNDFSNRNLLPGRYGNKSDQFSQEIRLQKDGDWGNLMVGGYYFSEDYETGSHVGINTLYFGFPDFLSDGARYGGQQETRGYAIFAEGTYEITDAFSITLGARYSHDQKVKINEYYQVGLGTPFIPQACNQPCNFPNVDPATPFFNENRSWGRFTPRVTLKYEFSPDAQAYATYSKGFKSGGYNLGLGPSSTGATFFDPENLTDYEVGFKGEFFDRSLRFNAAGFYYDYNNLQVTKVLGGNEVGQAILNAAEAKLYGFETEIVWLIDGGLRFDVAASVTHSEFKEFSTFDPTRPNAQEEISLAGNRLPNAPTFTATFGAQYSLHTRLGKFTLRGEGAANGKTYFEAFNSERVSEDTFTLLNAYLNWESVNSNIYGTLFIRNITDKTKITGAILGNGFSGFPIQAAFTQPRTFGAKLGVRF